MAKGLTIPLMRDSNRLSAITGSMRVAPKKTLSRITHRIPTATLVVQEICFPLKIMKTQSLKYHAEPIPIAR